MGEHVARGIAVLLLLPKDKHRKGIRIIRFPDIYEKLFAVVELSLILSQTGQENKISIDELISCQRESGRFRPRAVTQCTGRRR